MILKITLNPDTPEQDESLKNPTTIWTEVESVQESQFNGIDGVDSLFVYNLKNCPIVGEECDKTPTVANLTIGPEFMTLFIEWPESPSVKCYAEFKVEFVATVPDFPGVFERRT
jgi:hypothetical protein